MDTDHWQLKPTVTLISVQQPSPTFTYALLLYTCLVVLDKANIPSLCDSYQELGGHSAAGVLHLILQVQVPVHVESRQTSLKNIVGKADLS